MLGLLLPLGGGDPVPLLKKNLKAGRRESCDIVLRFANVSAHHCQFSVNGGYWFVRDLKSRNGIKVNGVRVTEKRLNPGDVVSIAKHQYEVRYSPLDLGATGLPPPDNVPSDIMEQSLLNRAGIKSGGRPVPRRAAETRYDVKDDRAGQIEDPNKPV